MEQSNIIKNDGSLVHLLHRASQRADELFAKTEPGSELTPRQFAVLLAVAGRSNINQMGIVAVTGIDRSTLAELVARLVKKGLISRQRTRHDARSYAVKLTREGEALLEELKEKAAGAESELIARVPAADREAFLRSLHSLTSTGQASTGEE